MSAVPGEDAVKAIKQYASRCYRIIYKVKQDTIIVSVVAIGIRRDGDHNDIYSLAKKLFSLKLLETKD